MLPLLQDRKEQLTKLKAEQLQKKKKEVEDAINQALQHQVLAALTLDKITLKGGGICARSHFSSESIRLFGPKCCIN